MPTMLRRNGVAKNSVYVCMARHKHHKTQIGISRSNFLLACGVLVQDVKHLTSELDHYARLMYDTQVRVPYTIRG